jgi:hypothetical protein
MTFIHSFVTMNSEHTCNFNFRIQNCKQANITTTAAAATMIVLLTVMVMVMLLTYINQLFSQIELRSKLEQHELPDLILYAIIRKYETSFCYINIGNFCNL